MRILIVDNYDSFTHNLYQQVLRIAGKTGTEVRVVRNDSIDLKGIQNFRPHGIILSPGPGGPEDSRFCLEIVHTLTGEVPILGVCLGHEVIAHSFGAVVTRAKRPLHGKTSMITHTASNIFHGIPSPTTVCRYHSLIVREEGLPGDFEISALSEEKEVMAISHRTLPIWGVQFHPESFLTPHGDILIKNFLSFCG